MGGKAFVNGKVVCEATISCQLVDRSRGRNSASASAQSDTAE
jgi:hypothetical protein